MWCHSTYATAVYGQELLDWVAYTVGKNFQIKKINPILF